MTSKAQETAYVLRDKETGCYFREHEWETTLTMAQIFRRKATAEYVIRCYMNQRLRYELVEVKITYEEVAR